jgi:hypothetical protein
MFSVEPSGIFLRSLGPYRTACGRHTFLEDARCASIAEAFEIEPDPADREPVWRLRGI